MKKSELKIKDKINVFARGSMPQLFIAECDGNPMTVIKISLDSSKDNIHIIEAIDNYGNDRIFCLKDFRIRKAK